MVYKLVLGDWSKDGHKQSEDFLFDCNYDVHKIRQAYKLTESEIEPINGDWNGELNVQFGYGLFFD